MGQLDNKKVAFLATHGVEQVELTEPWKKVEDEGGTPELISLESGEIQGFNHLDKGDSFSVDRTVAEASESDYDGLVLPGGVANPEADVVRDRTITSWPSMRTDIRNAGGNWVDEEVVVDNGLVSSRRPDDLPAFCAKLAEEIGEGVHEQQAASTALRPRVVSAGRSI
jgi:protease I